VSLAQADAGEQNPVQAQTDQIQKEAQKKGNPAIAAPQAQVLDAAVFSAAGKAQNQALNQAMNLNLQQAAGQAQARVQGSLQAQIPNPAQGLPQVQAAGSNPRVASLDPQAVVGRQPWNRDWVFESQNPAGAMPGLDQLKKNLKAESQGPGGVQTTPQAAPQAPATIPSQGVDLQTLQGLAMLQHGRGAIERSESSPGTGGGADGGNDGLTQPKAKAISFSGDEFLAARVKTDLDPSRSVQGAGKTETDSQGEKAVGKFDFKEYGNLQIQPMNADAPAVAFQQAQLAGATRQPTPTLFETKGQVVKGSMAKDRLSTESLMNLTGDIRAATKNPDGGEIRLRLFPDNLGELRIRVSSIGDRVNLRIQTASDKAKQVINESLGYLRDTLSSNQLHLTKADVTVLPASTSSNQDLMNGNLFNDSNGRQDQLSRFDAWNGPDSGGGRTSNDGMTDEDGMTTRRPRAVAPASVSGLSSAAGARVYQNTGASGRLDVMA
jgi:flagellar hook-length control protein FliK